MFNNSLDDRELLWAYGYSPRLVAYFVITPYFATATRAEQPAESVKISVYRNMPFSNDSNIKSSPYCTMPQ